MTITKLLAEGYRPSPVGERVLKRITELEPLHAFTKSAVLPEGAYLIPFVDAKGEVKGWVPFVTKPCLGSPVYVELEYPKDPTTVWRVTDRGAVKVAQAVEDW